MEFEKQKPVTDEYRESWKRTFGTSHDMSRIRYMLWHPDESTLTCIPSASVPTLSEEK